MSTEECTAGLGPHSEVVGRERETETEIMRERGACPLGSTITGVVGGDLGFHGFTLHWQI